PAGGGAPGARAVPRLPRRGRRGGGFGRGDLRRAAPVHRHLALGRRAVLHSCRQMPADHLHPGGGGPEVPADADLRRGRAGAFELFPTAPEPRGGDLDRRAGQACRRRDGRRGRGADRAPPACGREIALRATARRRDPRRCRPVHQRRGGGSGLAGRRPGAGRPRRGRSLRTRLLGAGVGGSHRRTRGGLARPEARDERAVLDRDPTDVVFLLDVDNTLLDNDRFKADLDARLRRDFGDEAGDRYWALYERERERLGYADHIAALQAFREGREDDPDLLRVSGYMLDYPFAECVYPGALEAVERLHDLGTPV